MAGTLKKRKLHGFNNLTKTLSFNIYDINYATTPSQRSAYIAYIDEAYNAERLTRILTEVAGIIGAPILNIAREGYEPQGASVTMLIAEESAGPGVPDAEMPGPLRPWWPIWTRATSPYTRIRRAILGMESAPFVPT